MKMSGNEEKVNRNTYNISCIKRVTRKFHVKVVQNNGKEMYKKVCCTCKVVFLLTRLTKFFWLFLLPSPLSITRYYILFE